MKKIQKKSSMGFYNLVVDRERALVLAYVFGYALQRSSEEEIQRLLEFIGMSNEELMGFVDEISDGMHERGWCINPSCDKNGHEER
jgi:hypothetical protein